jgi:hypothetical protein
MCGRLQHPYYVERELKKKKYLVGNTRKQNMKSMQGPSTTDGIKWNCEL